MNKTVVQDSSLIFFFYEKVTFYCKPSGDLKLQRIGRKFLTCTAKSREKVIEAAKKLRDLSLVTNMHVYLLL